jgi:hypothetical protein
MAAKRKRIHVIERDNRMIRLEGDLWESGYWAAPEATAKQLVGGSILFHKKQKEPSFFGGLILKYRIQDKGVYMGRVLFTFQYEPDHRGVLAEGGSWSQAMKVVSRGVVKSQSASRLKNNSRRIWQLILELLIGFNDFILLTV